MELLSPAGNFDKLAAAVSFGADAVYFGGPSFGLRAYAGNFSLDEMEHALKYLHERGKKGYVTVNIYPRTSELEGIEKYLKTCESLGADGLIISDPGIFSIARKSGIKVPISISTQANTTNIAAVNFWAEQGAKRVIMAREVRKPDLESIIKGSECEIETFIHGAICISMSGRCLISAYMTGRDANRGECTHPCRWRYAVQEESRPNEFQSVFEDDRGSYLYNSKDLCLLERIGELEHMGLRSGKIEGRMKSVMYVSIVTGVYRAAIDRAMQADDYKVDDYWRELLGAVSNRGYIEGFYSDTHDKDAINLDNSGYSRAADFLGVTVSSKSDEATISCRAKFIPGEVLTFITPQLKKVDILHENIYDTESNKVESSRPNYNYKLATKEMIPTGSLLMRF